MKITEAEMLSVPVGQVFSPLKSGLVPRAGRREVGVTLGPGAGARAMRVSRSPSSCTCAAASWSGL